MPHKLVQDPVVEPADRPADEPVDPALNLSVLDAIVTFAWRRPDWPALRRTVAEGLANWAILDLRYSFLVIAGLVLIGLVVQWFLPNGWSVWPVVFAGGILCILDEASARNGAGVPPLRAVAFIIAVLAAWLAVAMFLKAVHPVVPILGVGVAAYFGIRGKIKHRERMELMATRVWNGQCAHCGEEVDEREIDCPHCGELTNPEGIRARWSTLPPVGSAAKQRTRAVLKGETGTATARRKEQALLDKRVRPQGRKR